MEREGASGGKIERAKRSGVVRTGRDMARELGFSRNKEASTSWLRQFDKFMPPVVTSKTKRVINPRLVLSFQDVGSTSGSKIDERIEIYLQLFGPKFTPGDYRETLTNIGQREEFKEEWESLGIKMSDVGDLDKAALKAGEYQKLLGFLQGLEDKGFFEQILQEKLKELNLL